MDIIQQTFWQKTKRFFEPVKTNKLCVILWCLYFVVQWFFPILFIFLIRSLIGVLENWNIKLFNYTLIYYWILFSLNFFALYIVRNTWAPTFNKYQKSIESIYLLKYITINNNTYESVGTWKSIAIIGKWIKVWSWLLDRVFEQIVTLTLSIWLTIYLLSEINNFLIGLLIFLIIIGQII